MYQFRNKDTLFLEVCLVLVQTICVAKNARGCNSTCGMYLSLTLQHGIIGIDIHEVYFNNSNTWSVSPYPRARGTSID